MDAVVSPVIGRLVLWWQRGSGMRLSCNLATAFVTNELGQANLL
jgi:hypothetical protein